MLTAQYSYDLAVNSFEKAFAHVRNSLLMKKMSDVQNSNRGRTKPLTDSTRKRHKKEDSAKYNKIRVSIGDEYDRWTELKHTHLLIAVITRCSENFGTAADS
jgi:hypothetical protein